MRTLACVLILVALAGCTDKERRALHDRTHAVDQNGETMTDRYNRWKVQRHFDRREHR